MNNGLPNAVAIIGSKKEVKAAPGNDDILGSASGFPVIFAGPNNVCDTAAIGLDLRLFKRNCGW
jgi:hypothetical protein